MDQYEHRDDGMMIVEVLAESSVISAFRSAKSSEALERLCRAEQLVESLLRSRPNVPGYVASLANTRLKCGEVLVAWGCTENADTRFVQAAGALQLAESQCATVERFRQSRNAT